MTLDSVAVILAGETARLAWPIVIRDMASGIRAFTTRTGTVSGAQKQETPAERSAGVFDSR